MYVQSHWLQQLIQDLVTHWVHRDEWYASPLPLWWPTSPPAPPYHMQTWYSPTPDKGHRGQSNESAGTNNITSLNNSRLNMCIYCKRGNPLAGLWENTYSGTILTRTPWSNPLSLLSIIILRLTNWYTIHPRESTLERFVLVCMHVHVQVHVWKWKVLTNITCILYMHVVGNTPFFSSESALMTSSFQLESAGHPFNYTYVVEWILQFFSTHSLFFLSPGNVHWPWFNKTSVVNSLN